MRRKIEKYLAKKQGVDQANIRYTEDGRFDFMGDLEGVLAAVRGKDGTGRGRGKDRNSKKKKKGRDDMMRPSHHMMPMPYAPYGMAPHGMPRGPPMHMAMLGAKDKKAFDSRAPPFGYSPWQHPGAPLPPPDTSGMSPYNVNSMDVTPGKSKTALQNMDFTASCFSSARKSVFDSPKSIGGNLGLNMMSPTDSIGVRGMTPMSSLQDTFSTPFGKEIMEDLSPGGSNLNKMLFADDNEFHDSFLKTPNFRGRREKLHFRIGNDSALGSLGDMRINGVSISHSRVAISPISQSAASSSFFSEGDTELSSCFKSLAEVSLGPSSSTKKSPKDGKADQDDSDKVMMPPPKTPAPESKQSTDDMGAPTPFQSSSKISSLLTPSTAASTAANSSFWSHSLGFTPGNSLTPFRSSESPGSPAIPTSVNKEPATAKRNGKSTSLKMVVPSEHF